MGKNCPEALGDYLAGPNHTLPTSGTARFSSPLSVDDFIKKTQLHISTTKHQDRYRIGYSMSVGDSGETVQNDFYDEIIEKSEKAREEARVLYVAMTRAIRSFSWVEIAGKQNLSWQNLIETEV